MNEKALNERTRYTIIPSYSVVIHQGDQTVVLSNEEMTQLFMEITDPPVDAQRDGFQA